MLHDLAQPLTLLQCRLELGQMSDDPVELKESIGEALGDSKRLFDGLNQMRVELLGETLPERR
ncbi:MAG: hypothetical protein V4555_08765 [Acidobacteriota bacterium]